MQKPYYLGGAKYTLRKKMPIYQSDVSMGEAEQQLKVGKYHATKSQERSIYSANAKRLPGSHARGLYKQANQSVPDFDTFTTSAKSRVSAQETGNKVTNLRQSQHMNINANSVEKDI